MNQDEEFKQQIQANDAGERIAELEAENKSLRHILSLWKKTEAQKKIEELEEQNRKLRLDLHTLRFKEAEEQRFIWWIWNVYARNVNDLILSIISATTYDNETMAKLGKYGLPMKCFEILGRVKEGTDIIYGSDRIYDGTYLDVEISAVVKRDLSDAEIEELGAQEAEERIAIQLSRIEAKGKGDNEMRCKFCGQEMEKTMIGEHYNFRDCANYLQAELARRDEELALTEKKLCNIDRSARAEVARRDEIIARLKDAGNELYLKGCRNYLPLGDADWAWRALMKELEC